MHSVSVKSLNNDAQKITMTPKHLKINGYP